VLTAAAVRRLAVGMTKVKAIRGGIALSPYAGVGENVIRAIAGYAGRPIRRKRNGVFCDGYPLTEHLRYSIAPPGRVPLHNKDVFAGGRTGLASAHCALAGGGRDLDGAAPVPEALHRMLAALAWLVRVRLVPTLSPIAPLMHFMTNHVRWGEHRGGMFVEVEGTAASGARLKRAWHLIAEGNDGPLIPAMAVEAIVRNALHGLSPPAGARAAVRDLELDAYERLFGARTISTGIRGDDTSGTASLYASIWAKRGAIYPQKSATCMTLAKPQRRKGARAERGRSVLARIAATIIGFPPTNLDVPVRVQFDAANGVETWTRTFGSDCFRSRQFAGSGRSEHLLCERFGALTFAMALVVSAGRLLLVLRRWTIFGLPLPMWLCPARNPMRAPNKDVSISTSGSAIR